MPKTIEVAVDIEVNTTTKRMEFKASNISDMLPNPQKKSVKTPTKSIIGKLYSMPFTVLLKSF